MNEGPGLIRLLKAYSEDSARENIFEAYPEFRSSLESSRQWYDQTLHEMMQVLEEELTLLVDKGYADATFKQQLMQNSEYYLYDMHAFVLQYLLWLYLNDAPFTIRNCTRLTRASVYGTLGYRLLDLNMDEQQHSDPSVQLLSRYLIHEYEYLLLDVFGRTDENITALRRIFNAHTDEEFRQLHCRGKQPCYTPGNLRQMADKAIHLFAPFTLALYFFNRAEKEPALWNIFRCTFAPIQLIDDLQDVSSDVHHGHYSIFFTKDDLPAGPVTTDDVVQQYPDRIASLYTEGISLFDEARQICKSEEELIFLLNIEKTRLRFNHTFLNLEKLTS